MDSIRIAISARQKSPTVSSLNSPASPTGANGNISDGTLSSIINKLPNVEKKSTQGIFDWIGWK